MDTRDTDPTLGDLERAERRRRIVAAGIVVVAVVAVAVYLFLPRTLASGEVGGGSWQLRVAPLAVSSEVRLVGAEAIDDGPSRVPRSGGLDGTLVWRIGDPDDDAATIVVGPTPRGVSSVRVTTEQGVGEARIQRIGWRRYHVDRLHGHVEVVELVAFDEVGRPIEVSQLRPGSSRTSN